MEDKTEIWIKRHIWISLYILCILINILYYVFCYLHIFDDLYVMPCIDMFFNILMFILLVVVPVIWLAIDFWKVKMNGVIKFFVIGMSFMMLSIGVLLIILIIYLFNPMTLKYDKFTYNSETRVYSAYSCNLHNDCIDTEYVSRFIFLKKYRSYYGKDY